MKMLKNNIKDIDEYLKVTESVRVFKGCEIEVIQEILENYQQYPNKDYYLLDERQDNTVIGFVLFGRTPLTRFSWDIYWLVVDKNFHGRGFGRRLISKVEDFILSGNEKVILRVETSAKEEFTHAVNLYLKHGFKESGRIPNFYENDDDLIIFYKMIKNNGTIY